MKRVLITGMSGFLGSHLYEHIMKETDWYVVGLDRLGVTTLYGFDRVKESEYYDPERTKCLSYDLTKPIGPGLAREIGDVQIIYNVASSSHVDNSIKSPRNFIINNIDLEITMLDFANELHSKGILERFYQFSTDETYSTAPEGVYYKEGERHNPGNPYSASKSAQEMICRAYANTYKMPICISNCMNIVGEKQHPEKFLPKIINAALNQEELPIHASPDGKVIGTRFYIHARNVADAVLFISTQTHEFLHHIDASKGVFNIVGEAEYDNLQFAKTVAKFTGKPLQYKIVDMDVDRPGVDLRYALDGGKLAKLGWKPKVNIEENIKKIVEWTLKPENRKWLKKWLSGPSKWAFGFLTTHVYTTAVIPKSYMGNSLSLNTGRMYL